MCVDDRGWGGRGTDGHDEVFLRGNGGSGFLLCVLAHWSFSGGGVAYLGELQLGDGYMTWTDSGSDAKEGEADHRERGHARVISGGITAGSTISNQ